MAREGWSLRDLFAELKRRRVFRVAATYAAVGFVLVQAAAYVFDALLFPEWAHRMLVVFLLFGFPVAVLLAWAFEITPEGVRPTRGRPPAAGGAKDAGADRKTRVLRTAMAVGAVTVIALAVGGAGWMVWTSWLRPGTGRAAAGGERAADDAALPATRIAVLYFDDHSPGQDLGPVARGLTEALIHELGTVEGLAVVSRNGVKPFRDPDISLDSVARLLGAGSLVGGSVERDGDRLRVHVQLIDGVTGTQIGSEMIERAGSDILALRDGIVREVARLLRKELGEAVQLRETRAETDSDEAWRLYHQALGYTEYGDTLRLAGDTAAARRMYVEADSLLARAEELSPGWADPSVRRAWVAYGRARLAGGGLVTAFDEARLREGISHANRVLESDERSAPALSVRGLLRYYLAQSLEGDSAGAALERAEADLTEAVALDPGRARAWAQLADLYRSRGKFAEARMAIRRSREADPFLGNERNFLFLAANLALEVGDVSGAVDLIDEGRSLFPDNPAFDAAYLVAVAGANAPRVRPDTAWRILRRIDETRPGGAGLEETFLVAAVLARAGLGDSARAVVARSSRDGSPGGPFGHYYEANYWLQLGDVDSVLARLEVFLEALPHMRTYVANDWWWEPLRGDPRFQRLVEGDSAEGDGVAAGR